MRRGKKFQYTGKQRNKDQKFDVPGGKECGRCGKGRKHTWKDCPAKDVECRKCHKKGHFAVACRNGQAVYTVTEVLSDSDSQDYAFLGEVSTQTTKPWIEKVTLNGDAISFKLDTGADVTSIPESVFDPKRDGKLDKPLKRLVGAGKHLLDVKGCFQGKMCAKGRSTDQPVYVVAGLTQTLLGLPAIQAMRLVHRVNEVTQTDTDFKALYPSVFQGLGKLKEPYHIELEQGAVPYALSTPRRVPLPLRDKVREELERMERMGVISKVTEPTAWCSRMVVVPKPTKNKLRICVDLTPLNAAVKRERHILPAVDQTLAMMSDAKVFTKLDARSGFWQIPLTPESRPLTTFITPFGRYFFNRLPFGIASVPEHFQRRMSQMFENFEGVLCHADDVLVYGRNRQEHDQRLHRVLQKMQEEGLTLNEKCEFRQEHITFVGHRVSSKGIEPDPNNVKAILQMPEPTQVEDVRRLMGMANYLSKFMPQMATITMPLKDLLREKNEWVWGEPQQTAFKKLKTGLAQPLLGLPAIQAMRLVHRVNEVTQTDTDFKALYPSVFQGLGKLKEPYHIELEQGAVPYALSTPRRVPLPLRDKVREELERMERMGVISKVTEPTAWCSRMVVVPKPTKNKLRICVDLTPLNAAVKRERHILPAVDQTLAMMSDAKVFTKLDARSGFWQIPLTPESRPLTTFITPFGRYFFNRLPFGIASVPEHFQRRMSQMFENFEGVLCHADDVLVYGRNRQEHDQRLHRVLQKMQEEGLTLNEKCEFRQEHITFVGHRVSSKGIEPDPNNVKAILQMPEPTQVEDVRRLMGMANYLSKFMPQMATITMPLKDLLREKNEWVWGEPQQTAFKKLKSGLSSPKCITIWNRCHPHTEASR
ncbi:Retrovirus-related Pol poly from transposon opus [Labeo rohita]|uniref:ribonuclease H n=1 Tax=Labeo rohita TaxID=84645 RepID=A0A498P1N5_LABRO|nr:Retrovirus-related Pol poly from transposon opus [Labeo rohita]